MNETRLSVRVDPDLKNDAETLFGEMGLTLTAAVNVFLRQSVREGGLPFRPTTVNPSTAKALSEVASGNVESYGSVEEWWGSLNED